MLILKKINNSAALALDVNGSEIVVFGKGIGFPKTPYELTDESVIQRIFRDVSPDTLQFMGSLSDEALGLAVTVAHLAESELACQINPNLPFTLADHIQFAAERLREGIALSNPLAAEIPYVCPAEYALGLKACELMCEVFGLSIPETEACSIALHIANAEGDGGGLTGSIDDAMKAVHAIDDVLGIVEDELGVAPIDRLSHDCARFIMHLRYLLKRLDGSAVPPAQTVSMLPYIAKDFPDAQRCAERVGTYLAKRFGKELGDEEILYLMMYINRLQVNMAAR